MKNFNVLNVTLIVVGAILIYCGIKNVTPYQALQMIFTGSKAGSGAQGLVFKSSGQGSDKGSFGKGGGDVGGGGGGGGSGSW